MGLPRMEGILNAGLVEKVVSPRNFSDHTAQHFRSGVERFCLLLQYFNILGGSSYLKLFFCAHLSGLEKRGLAPRRNLSSSLSLLDRNSFCTL
ncbi:hypothetical protein CEXT_293601 [Caerostris extrusa]|uniref:Uncharacterized protein n=1 Tax=Caerostris extrusa TaxID=172846 RepID=A0AAV4MVK6_CAEEX|nr:hypothetical protein CEXT_293601 [Caerostris extrusa]